MEVLKPGQLGKGILVEYDAGHISPNDNVKIIKEMKDRSLQKEPIIFNAILQKWLNSKNF